jgi:hypothetical protein
MGLYNKNKANWKKNFIWNSCKSYFKMQLQSEQIESV